MNISEKASVKDSLDILESRLEELLDRSIELEDGWEEISANISKVHDIFNEVVKAYILECRLLLNRLDSWPWPFSLTDDLIEHLYLNTFHLRQLHATLFGNSSSNRIYYYLFFRELMHCFKGISSPPEISCVMIGTGSTAYWYLDKMLIGDSKAFRTLLEPEVQKALDNAVSDNIAGFECDFQESLDRQMVLAHEMFHAIVRKNSWLNTEFENMASDPNYYSAFNNAGHSLTSGNIEEFFCDFGAMWFFGPIYAKAFFEEIIFREKGGGIATHPHRILRLQMILCTWPKKTKYHPYLLTLSKYLKGHKNTNILPQKNMDKISKKFRELLHSLGIQRYISTTNEDIIKYYIENNMPYIYGKRGEDLRGLMNGLPDKVALPERARMNYSEFLFESVRKNAMWRRFEHEKERLKARLPTGG